MIRHLYVFKIYRFVLTVLVFVLFSSPTAAQEINPSQSVKNPVTIILTVIMVLLLGVILMLARILLNAAKTNLENEKRNRKNAVATVLTAVTFVISFTAKAQSAPAVKQAPSLVTDLSDTSFYFIITVIFIEIVIALAMLFNIWRMTGPEKIQKVVSLVEAELNGKDQTSGWWSRINRFKPIEHETDIDLGHDYDGIRELDNRLPPWWLYGFYLTIIIAVIYFWRFHVSHSAPLSAEEYTISVAEADAAIKKYTSEKGEDVNENTVSMLGTPEDLAAGKAIYLKSCAVCHKENGGGEVGPNLTDDYWLHGSDIKKIFKTIRYGISAMPQWQNTYSNREIAQVASFVKTLHGSNPPNGKVPQGILEKENEATNIDTLQKEELSSISN